MKKIEENFNIVKDQIKKQEIESFNNKNAPLLEKDGGSKLNIDVLAYRRKIADRNYMRHATQKIALDIVHSLSHWQSS